MDVSNTSQFEPGLKTSGVPKVLSAGTELMILFDGRVLVHNLTPELRGVLQEALGGETVAGVSLDDCHSAETVQARI
jgi:hypothetical protein